MIKLKIHWTKIRYSVESLFLRGVKISVMAARSISHEQPNIADNNN
jgi:hypothetical protein